MLIAEIYEKNALGVSAVQMGVDMSMFAMMTESQPKVCINPEIVAASFEMVLMEEGCLSFPGIFANIKRPKAIKARWQNAKGEVIRPALLWNDTRSAQEATELNNEVKEISKKVGSALVAAFTASKIRWLATNERANSKQVAAVCLPHDYLSWKLSDSNDLADLFTDRSDASGTGYFDGTVNEYVSEIFKLAHLSENQVILPKVLKPNACKLRKNPEAPT